MEQGVIPQHIAGKMASSFVWQVLQVACNTCLTAVKYEGTNKALVKCDGGRNKSLPQGRVLAISGSNSLLDAQ